VSVHRSSTTLWLTSATLLASLGVWLAFALAGWPGESNGCFENDVPMCFCERAHVGLVAQPSNTFSNVGFMGMGLWLAWLTDHGTLYAHRHNLLNRYRAYPRLFACVVAFLGPGSMFLHASHTKWGHRVDVASMYLFACLMISYAAARAFRLSTARFAALYTSLCVVFVATTFVPSVPDEAAFGVLLAAAGAAEAGLARWRPETTRERRWIVAALVAFLAAFAVWVRSLSNGPWCNPDSALQGHAAWHLACAIAAGCTVVYLRSEQEPGVSDLVRGDDA